MAGMAPYGERPDAYELIFNTLDAPGASIYSECLGGGSEILRDKCINFHSA